MKKLITLLALSFLMLGCQSPTEEIVVDESIPSTDYAPEIDELLSSISDIDLCKTIVSGNSALDADATYGFTYIAENAIDQDFSTAWCPSADFLTQEWSIQFEETVLPGTVGIQNGFARSEEIFFENNRVKSADLYFDGDEFIQNLEFEDTYDMQFFDLTELPLRELTLVINDVYPGSKYDDTCISEIDFWSNYVQEKDADAAYDFYLENKANDAIRPVTSNDIQVVPSDALSHCGSFNASAYPKSGNHYESAEENEWGYKSVFADNDNDYTTIDRWFEAGLSVSLSAKMSDDATENDELTIRWWHAPLNMDTGEREWSVYNESTISPQECNDGTLYLSMDQPSSDLPGPFSNYRVEVIYDDAVIGSTSFNFVQ